MDARKSRRSRRPSAGMAILLAPLLLIGCASRGTTAPTATSAVVIGPSQPAAYGSPTPVDESQAVATTPSAPVTLTPTASPSPRTASSPPLGSDLYTVVTGDTLWDLAEWYGTSVGELLRFNPQITDRSLIRVGDRLVMPPPSAATLGREITIDFSLAGNATAFDSEFFQGEPIVFAKQDCRWETCQDWFIGYVQGDDAIVNGPTPVTFTRPVSALSVRVAPGLQGKADYRLAAYDRAGNVLASKSVIVAQYESDPHAPFGYFTVELGPLPRPARSFTFEQTNLEMGPGVTNIEYGMSEITFTTLR